MDNVLIASNYSATIAQIIGNFRTRIEMKYLGSPVYALDSIFISISPIVRSTYRKTARPTLFSSNLECLIANQGPPYGEFIVKVILSHRLVSCLIYSNLQAVGRLMYLMVGTHPDLAFVVANLSQYCKKPLKSHWIAVKRVMRYISCTSDRGLQYGTIQIINLVRHSETDWGGCFETRK